MFLKLCFLCTEVSQLSGDLRDEFLVSPGGELPILSDGGGGGGSDTGSVWKTQKYTEFCRFLPSKIYLSLQGK